MGVQEENSAKLFDRRSEGKEGWVRARMKSDWVDSGCSEAEKWGMGKVVVNWPLILYSPGTAPSISRASKAPCFGLTTACNFVRRGFVSEGKPVTGRVTRFVTGPGREVVVGAKVELYLARGMSQCSTLPEAWPVVRMLPS